MKKKILVVAALLAVFTGCDSYMPGTTKEVSDNVLPKSTFSTTYNSAYYEFDNWGSGMSTSSGWGNGDMFDCMWSGNNVWINDSQLYMKIVSEENIVGGITYPYTGGEYATDEAFSYGKYTVRMKAGKGDGLVTGFFTYTGAYYETDWHEIDVEILGKDTTKLQINYFTDATYGEPGQANESTIDLGFDASEDYHDYTIEWLPEMIIWYVDGVMVHTETGGALKPDGTYKTSTLPYTPGRVMLNFWPGNDHDFSRTNTIDWLGYVDDSNLPAYASFDNLELIPYSYDEYTNYDYPNELNGETGETSSTGSSDSGSTTSINSGLISNGDFSNGLTSWSTYIAAGAGDIYVYDGACKVESWTDTSQDWEVQLQQSGFNVTAGKKYKVTFDAVAETINKDIKLELSNPTDYSYLSETQIATISTEWNQYNFDFIATTSSDARVVFNYGGSVGNVTINNVKLIEVGTETDTTTDLELISNDIANWNTYVFQNAGNIYRYDDAWKVESWYNNSQDWHLQLQQSGFNVTAGKKYKVTFDAVAETINKDIKLELSNPTDYSYLSEAQIATISTEWNQYNFDFIATTSSDARFVFNYGGSAGNVTISNITLVELGTAY